MSGSSSKRRSSRRRTTRPTGTGSSGDSSPNSSPNSSGDEGDGEDPWAAITQEMANALRDTQADADEETDDDQAGDEQANDETFEALLRNLTALGRGETGGTDEDAREDTEGNENTGDTEDTEDTEQADALTLSKRDLLADSGFETTFGVPGSTVELVPHPKFHASVNTPTPARTPIYQRKPNGDLGDETERLGYGDFLWYTIGQPALVTDTEGVSAPVRDPGGIPTVICKGELSGDTYLIGRNALVEKTYQATVNAIDATDKQYDADQSEFWTGMIPTIKALTEVRLSHRLPALPRAAVDQRKTRGVQPIFVPPGTYPNAGIVERRLEAGQFTPFSLAIRVGAEELVINPDVVVGDLLPDTPEENPPQVVEALQQVTPETKEEKVRAPRLTAKQIVDFFTGDATGSTTLRQYMTLPAEPDWLGEEQVHYVTQDQMGALLVLGKMPDTPEAIDQARSNDRFADGETTNGLQLDNHIYVKEDRTGLGTEYHETIHKLSSPAVLEVLGFWFNEGLTEHFTQLLLEGGTLVRDKDQYGSQHQAITALMDHAGVTETELANAYFRGDLQPLYDRVAHAAVHPPFSRSAPFSLDGYAARVDSKRSLAAQNTLMIACAATPQDDSYDETTTTTTTTTTTADDDDTEQGDDQGDDH